MYFLRTSTEDSFVFDYLFYRIRKLSAAWDIKCGGAVDALVETHKTCVPLSACVWALSIRARDISRPQPCGGAVFRITQVASGPIKGGRRWTRERTLYTTVRTSSALNCSPRFSALTGRLNPLILLRTKDPPFAASRLFSLKTFGTANPSPPAQCLVQAPHANITVQQTVQHDGHLPS